jgi:hypothetical protein
VPNIDIPVPTELKEAFTLPPCEEVRIPFPKPLKVQLPSGGSIQAFSDISKGIPTDCAMTFSLMMQIAPLLASIECLLKILKLLKPLIDIITGLTKVPPAPPAGAIVDFIKAAGDLVPCFLIPTPANIIPFLKDLLCLIIKALNCFLGQLKTLLGVMKGLTLQLQRATGAGNMELMQSLQCAQKNAQAQAGHLTASIEPIGVILDLAGALFGIAGVEPIKLPTMGSQTDIASLERTVSTVQQVVATLQIAADALGGC